MSSITNVQKARAQLLLSQPFFATLVMSTPLVIDRETRYAATDGRSIFINPETMETLPIGIIKTILVHEALHIILTHVPRMIAAKYDRLQWNYATDYVINLILHDNGFDAFEGWLYDRQYDKMTADEVYALLQRQSTPKQGQGQGQGQGQPQQGQGTSDASGTTMPPPENGILGIDMREPAFANNPEEMAKLTRAAQQRTAQAANMARMAGKMPAGMEQLVSDILEPAVPWPQVLRDYMTRTAQDDESWSKRNRRFTQFLPSRCSERMGEIVVIGDSSGSMYEDVKKGIAEVRSIAETLRPERIRLVWADAEIAGEQVFEEDEEVIAVVQGGGGTDMRVPLEYVEQYNPQVCILITDGYTPWPAHEPPYPLIILCTTPIECPPIGQLIRI
jgi:predicted metal-dependent peptidase